MLKHYYDPNVDNRHGNRLVVFFHVVYVLLYLLYEIKWYIRQTYQSDKPLSCLLLLLEINS